MLGLGRSGRIISTAWLAAIIVRTGSVTSGLSCCPPASRPDPPAGSINHHPLRLPIATACCAAATSCSIASAHRKIGRHRVQMGWEPASRAARIEMRSISETSGRTVPYGGAEADADGSIGRPGQSTVAMPWILLPPGAGTASRMCQARGGRRIRIEEANARDGEASSTATWPVCRRGRHATYSASTVRLAALGLGSSSGAARRGYPSRYRQAKGQRRKTT